MTKWMLNAPLVSGPRGIRHMNLFMVKFNRRVMTADKWRNLGGVRWAEKSN